VSVVGIGQAVVSFCYLCKTENESVYYWDAVRLWNCDVTRCVGEEHLMVLYQIIRLHISYATVSIQN